MSASISFDEHAVFQALRALLLQMLTAPTTGLEVIRAQVNRVPEPRSLDFIVMTQIARTRLEMNTDTNFDGFYSIPAIPGTHSALQPTQMDVQLDIHGPSGSSFVQIISTLWRDEYTTSYFQNLTTIDAQSLYSSDPRQVPFVNSEDQWETRWTIDLSLQLNQVVVVPQQFADQLNAGLINVDTVYPP